MGVLVRVGMAKMYKDATRNYDNTNPKRLQNTLCWVSYFKNDPAAPDMAF